jgi:methyl-accepting chemotaxis protein
VARTHAEVDVVLIVGLAPATRRELTLREHLPVAPQDIVGQSIDIFHKDPAYQRRILRNEKNLPLRTTIQIGDQFADLLVSATYDEQGAYIGPMVTWEVIWKT